MYIPQLGPLHPDSRIPEWLVSEPISVPYFDGRPLTFTLDGLAEADVQDVQSAVGVFLALDSTARLEASPYVFRDYQRMIDAVGEDQVECHVTSPEATIVLCASRRSARKSTTKSTGPIFRLG